MTLAPPSTSYWRALRHFAATRAVEVLALQASPLLGCVLGGIRIERGAIVPLVLLLFGSCALTAHIFVFNDWAGQRSDLRDPLRAPLVFSQNGIGRGQVAVVAFVLLALALLAFAALGATALAIGGAIAALGFLYSASPVLGKSTPIAASLNHVAGGTLHFLLGYTGVHPLDANGVWIGIFFGLVFAAGHLNQEVRDYAGDRINHIRTLAVVYGPRPAFIVSVFTFSAAYAMLTVLAALGLLPRLLLASPAVWLLHLVWALAALRRGLSFDTALWMQQRYRALFALIAIALLAGSTGALWR